MRNLVNEFNEEEMSDFDESDLIFYALKCRTMITISPENRKMDLTYYAIEKCLTSIRSRKLNSKKENSIIIHELIRKFIEFFMADFEK